MGGLAHRPHGGLSQHGAQLAVKQTGTLELVEPGHIQILIGERTAMKKFLCTWLGEVCYSCSLTVLPGSAWVMVNYVQQRIFFTSVRVVVMLILSVYALLNFPKILLSQWKFYTVYLSGDNRDAENFHL